MTDDLEDVWRRESAHVLGALLRRHGDLADCEDAAQDALAAAATQWPRDGVPDSPRGWLIRVASRRLIDRVRSDRAREAREETVEAALGVTVEAALGVTVEAARGATVGSAPDDGAPREPTASVCCCCAATLP